MRGLELARKYYEEFGAPAIHENFPDLEGRIAIGLAGSGSECYGFDDAVSADHDLEPGFCMWIPGEAEIDSRTAFRLERMYAKLPKEYMGLRRELLQPAGGNRRGVLRISDFLERHIGRRNTDFTPEDWFMIPEYAFSEVVNGQVWRDDSGEFTRIREVIGQMPGDVRLKKLAGSLYIMGQSGNYNYTRCIAHGERGAAQLSLAEYAKHTMHAAFLLSGVYMPYYKWSLRALRGLPYLSELSEKLEYLLNTGNEPENVLKKQQTIEACTGAVLSTVEMLGLSEQSSDDPGKCAEQVNDRIRDSFIRNADILAGAGI